MGGLAVSASNRITIFQRLTELGIVPVIRSNSTTWAEKAIDRLYQLGFRTFEITMSIPEATLLIKQFSTEKGLLIGAGTVIDANQAERCIQAGAQYVISPCLVPELPKICQDADVVSILSGMTPSEVLLAWQLGSDAVKVFPAQSVGGPSHIKALKSVFPDIPLIPTGGVNITNIAAYFSAGSTLVGVGGDLVNERLFEQTNEGNEPFGQAYLHTIQKIKSGGSI
jgi:2-dehydro-3-deoxyphosphogluconate aldolase/(4S)-4-hydroxy-2-oxoglutarate aldolase